MKATEQTIMQIERAIRKIVQKFPASEDPELLTDIHIRVIQESGELLAFDDDEEENKKPRIHYQRKAEPRTEAPSRPVMTEQAPPTESRSE